MVAVVSGSGLGLFTTTRGGGDSQVGRGNENVFVNTTNGNLIVQSLDENVAALGELPATSFTVVALPMKIGGGSGGPLRIVAILPPGR